MPAFVTGPQRKSAGSGADPEVKRLPRRVAEEDRDPDAADDDIPGANKPLARYIRRLVGNASTRTIQNRTGVNAWTVGSLLKGGPASQENLIKIARAYRLNPNVLLRLAGLEEVPEFDLIDWTTSSSTISSSSEQSTEEHACTGESYRGGYSSPAARRIIEEAMRYADAVEKAFSVGGGLSPEERKNLERMLAEDEPPAPGKREG